eukprot:359833-Chlamydomonas_euryale.AAC.26
MPPVACGACHSQPRAQPSPHPRRLPVNPPTVHCCRSAHPAAAEPHSRAARGAATGGACAGKADHQRHEGTAECTGARVVTCCNMHCAASAGHDRPLSVGRSIQTDMER